MDQDNADNANLWHLYIVHFPYPKPLKQLEKKIKKIVEGLPSMAVNSFKRPKPSLTLHT